MDDYKASQPQHIYWKFDLLYMPKLQSQFKSFKSVLSLQCSNYTSAKRHATAKAKAKAEFDVLGISFGKEDAVVNIIC